MFSELNQKSLKFNIVVIVLLTLIAGGAWYMYYSNVFTGLLYNDAMDYASMGRNIARGDGVISSYITPLGLQYYGVPHPNPWRAPLWPAILAGATKVLGFQDNAVAVTTGVFYILTIPLVYLLGRKLFGVGVGIGSALVFAFSSLSLHFSVSGLTEPLAAFFMCLWIYAVTIDKFKNPAGSFLIGAIGGLFYLARYNALMVIPFIFLYLLWRSKKQRIGTAVLFLTGFVLPTLPWLWRNYSLFGSPLFSLQKFEPVMFTSSYPEYTLYMMMKKPDVGHFLINNFPEVWAKIKAGLLTFYGNVLDPQFTGVHFILILLFVVSLFIPLSRPPLRKEVSWIKVIVAGSLFTQLAALSVVHYIPRLFFIFTPFYIILGLGLLNKVVETVLDNMNIRRSFRNIMQPVLIGAIIFGFLWTNQPDWKAQHNPEPAYQKFSEQINYVAKVADKKDLIVSNDGHILSWYGDRYAVKIPYSPDMLPELNGYQEAKYMFLSSKASWNIPEADQEWQKVYWNKPRELYGYQLQHVFADGSVVYIKDGN